MTNKKKTNLLDQARAKHPILLNVALMIVAAIAIGYIALLFVDVFTSHGQERHVPDVRNLTLEQAVAKLDAAGLKWDISQRLHQLRREPPAGHCARPRPESRQLCQGYPHRLPQGQRHACTHGGTAASHRRVDSARNGTAALTGL